MNTAITRFNGLNHLNVHCVKQFEQSEAVNGLNVLNEHRWSNG